MNTIKSIVCKEKLHSNNLAYNVDNSALHNNSKPTYFYNI